MVRYSTYSMSDQHCWKSLCANARKNKRGWKWTFRWTACVAMTCLAAMEFTPD